MAAIETPHGSRYFQSQLQGIRNTIDSLPEQQQPYLRNLASQAEETHRNMQEAYFRIREWVDDMRFAEAAVKSAICESALDMGRSGSLTCNHHETC
jgi:hypothetical protein